MLSVTNNTFMMRFIMMSVMAPSSDSVTTKGINPISCHVTQGAKVSIV